MTMCDKSVLAPECDNKNCKECFPMTTPSQPNREERFDEAYLNSTRKRYGRLRLDIENILLVRDDMKEFIKEEIAQALEEQRESIVKTIEDLGDRFQCAACGGMKVNHTLACDQRKAIIASINEPKAYLSSRALTN